MAKKKSGLATVDAGTVAQMAGVTLITVPPGGTLEVTVDVGPMTVPYTVTYDGHTVIKSLVDRKEMVPVAPGDRILAWAFAHASKKWSHKLTCSVNGGAEQVLETRSEANKHADHSVGIAVVRQ